MVLLLLSNSGNGQYLLPEYIAHVDSTKPLIYVDQFNGSYQQYERIGQRDSIPIAKRAIGMMVTADGVTARYDGPNVADSSWTNPLNWKVFTPSTLTNDSVQWTKIGYRIFPKDITDSVGIGLTNPSSLFEVKDLFIDSNYTLKIGNFAGYNSTNSYNVFIGDSAGYSTTIQKQNTFVGYNAGRHNIGASNTFIGKKAGEQNTIGGQNNYIGKEAGRYNKTGSHNNAQGCQALRYDTAGSNNVAIGDNAFQLGQNFSNAIAIGFEAGNNNNADNNTFIGYHSGFLNVVGIYNTFIGSQSGLNNTASENTFYGANSGYSNITGTQNVFIGKDAGFNNTSGNYNSFLGFESGYNNSGDNNIIQGYLSGFNNSGNYNIIQGYLSGYNNSGDYNLFQGYNSGRLNTSGSNNIFLGYLSGYRTTTGSNNIFIGGRTNELGGGDIIGNIGIGVQSLRYVQGDQNTAIGNSSGNQITTGNGNTTIGANSGKLIGSGSNNTVIGYLSGYNSNDANNNVSIGYMAGYSADSSDNVFIGTQTGYGNGINSKGARNIFLGHQAGYKYSTGSQNTYIGYQSGYNNQVGIGNVFIGYQSGYNELDSNRLYIENSSSSTPLIYGEFDNDLVGINTFKDSLHSTLEIGGSLGLSIKTVSVDYTLTKDDFTLLADGSSNSVTLTLPLAKDVVRRIYVIKAIDVSNTVTITTSGENIDHSSNYVFSIQDEVVKLQSDGTQWWIIN